MPGSKPASAVQATLILSYGALKHLNPDLTPERRGMALAIRSRENSLTR
jgi:hypothetical protein